MINGLEKISQLQKASISSLNPYGKLLSTV
jgi:hypothetical protein